MRGVRVRQLRNECLRAYMQLPKEIRVKKSFKNAFRLYKEAYNRGEL